MWIGVQRYSHNVRMYPSSERILSIYLVIIVPQSSRRKAEKDGSEFIFLIRV